MKVKSKNMTHKERIEDFVVNLNLIANDPIGVNTRGLSRKWFYCNFEAPKGELKFTLSYEEDGLHGFCNILNCVDLYKSEKQAEQFYRRCYSELLRFAIFSLPANNGQYFCMREYLRKNIKELITSDIKQ